LAPAWRRGLQGPEVSGPNQILAGSDHPHFIGKSKENERKHRDKGLTLEDEAEVFGLNKRRIPTLQ
jgi:hypothetical protein